MQRYAYMSLAAICLLAVAHGPQRIGLLVYYAIADLLAGIGIGLAIWQVTKGASMTTCLSDPIGEFVNGLPSANWWPEFLFANGGCADKYPPIFGISVPLWSLICFIAFYALITSGLIATLRQRRAV